MSRTGGARRAWSAGAPPSGGRSEPGRLRSRPTRASSSASVAPGPPQPRRPPRRANRPGPRRAPPARGAERPHPAARLGEVDEPEIEREGRDDRLRGIQVEPVELGRRAGPARGSSSRRRAIVRRRIRSTSSNSSGPACSAMTWPRSAPSSRTSRASGSRAPADPIPSGSAATAAEARGRPRRLHDAALRGDRPRPSRHRTATFRPQPFSRLVW